LGGNKKKHRIRTEEGNVNLLDVRRKKVREVTHNLQPGRKKKTGKREMWGKDVEAKKKREDGQSGRKSLRQRRGREKLGMT